MKKSGNAKTRKIVIAKKKEEEEDEEGGPIGIQNLIYLLHTGNFLKKTQNLVPKNENFSQPHSLNAKS